jgi:hypothetical protein
MRKIFKLGAVLALVSSPATAMAQGQESCLTDAESRALFAFMIPEALGGVVRTCKPSLPATAFLATRGEETLVRYRAASTGSWPGARAAFLKRSDTKDDAKVISGMSDAALQPFVSEALAGFVAKDVKAADCPRIDRFVAALAPMPPENVAELITALVGLVESKGKNSLRLC